RNVKKSASDYAIYFLTLIFGVCVFYVFNALESQSAIMRISSSQALIFRQVGQIMSGISVFVSAILGLLIVYANRFLMRRRKKEFGIYLLLGMDKAKMSFILVLETLYVGLFSLAAGLLLGALLSQAMSLVTAKLLHAQVSNFVFVFSPQALGKTIGCFSLIFLVALVFNMASANNQTLLGMLYANRKNEGFKTPKVSVSVGLFLASLALLGVAYWLAIDGPSVTENCYQIAAVLGVAGTALFFYSLSGFLLKAIQQSKKVYLSGLNMFVLRQINSKIATTCASTTLVCLTLFVSICTLSSGISFSTSVYEGMKESAPFDASHAIFPKDDEDYLGVDLIEEAKANGIDIGAFAKDAFTLRYRRTGVTMPVELYSQIFDMELLAISLSEFNKASVTQGLEPLALEPGQFAVNQTFSNKTAIDYLNSWLDAGNTATVSGETLSFKPGAVFERMLETSEYQANGAMIVISDELAKDLPSARDVVSFVYNDAENAQQLCVDAFLGFGPESANNMLQTRIGLLDRGDATSTILSYLAVYLGLIFLIASAAILAIGLLSETSDNLFSYGLLRKVGAEEKMVTKALYSQISIRFMMPLGLALAHSIAGIIGASKLVSNFELAGILGGSLFTALVIAAVFGGYCFATCQVSKAMLGKR
ncbi:MAG: FtsX-like permease family protein, partial [Clostridiales bacterium]|nr:FtsX-like permease family protein [Clostridiales bacterium]